MPPPPTAPAASGRAPLVPDPFQRWNAVPLAEPRAVGYDIPMSMWPWWAGALALASIAVLHAVVTGRPLGVSGRVRRALESSAGGERADARLFLGAVVAGGLLSVLLAGGVDGVALQGFSATAVRFFGDGPVAWLALFGGGALVGFGTTVAGGCTSGHGLVGCARLEPGSLVATAAFFGTAVAVAFALSRVFP